MPACRLLFFILHFFLFPLSLLFTPPLPVPFFFSIALVDCFRLSLLSFFSFSYLIFPPLFLSHFSSSLPLSSFSTLLPDLPYRLLVLAGFLYSFGGRPLLAFLSSSKRAMPGPPRGDRGRGGRGRGRGRGGGSNCRGNGAPSASRPPGFVQRVVEHGLAELPTPRSVTKFADMLAAETQIPSYLIIDLDNVSSAAGSMCRNGHGRDPGR